MAIALLTRPRILRMPRGETLIARSGIPSAHADPGLRILTDCRPLLARPDLRADPSWVCDAPVVWQSQRRPDASLARVQLETRWCPPANRALQLVCDTSR